MVPQQVSPTAERGFYIIWDPARFQRDRVGSRHGETSFLRKESGHETNRARPQREFTLHYGDLDTTLGGGAQ